MGTRRYQILAGVSGVALVGVLIWSHLRIDALETTIETLRASRGEREAQPAQVQPRRRTDEVMQPVAQQNPEGTSAGSAGREPGAPESSYQLLAALDADAGADPRSYAERLQALLTDHPGDEAAAIACRFIFDKATDARGLPDYALQALYANQTSPDLRRVIAQVLSQRGNDVLLENQVAAWQVALGSTQPKDRLEALNQLGKIHSVQAVDAIAPALHDSDSTVRVAALFALRDSGNQRHLNLVEPLLNDPDPSVRTLAGNVASALKNLSATARTSYSRADIEAELPPIANPMP